MLLLFGWALCWVSALWWRFSVLSSFAIILLRKIAVFLQYFLCYVSRVLLFYLVVTGRIIAVLKKHSFSHLFFFFFNFLISTYCDLFLNIRLIISICLNLKFLKHIKADLLKQVGR